MIGRPAGSFPRLRRAGAGAIGVLVLTLLPAIAPAQPALPPGFAYLRDVDASIAQDMRYAGRDNFTGRPLPGYEAGECILTSGAAAALARAQAELAGAGLGLKVYDCYRPARASRAMVRWALDGGSDGKRFYPALTKASLLSGYIAAHSRHATGTAVDLTLVARPARQTAAFDPRAHYGSCIEPADRRAPDTSLDMGTGYDCFDARSHTNSPAITSDQRRRRVLLVTTLARHGFHNYHREWWHFTFASPQPAAAHDFAIAPRPAR